MKIVVLGSRGQIGEPFTRHLIENGHEVCGIDLLDGSENDLRKNDNLYVDEQIKKSDFVFFLAYDLGGSQYLKKYQDTFDFINNNTSMMVNVFNILKKYNEDHFLVSENFGFGEIGFENLINVIYNKRVENVVKILETPYVNDRTIPPYKKEIEMIKSKVFCKI